MKGKMDYGFMPGSSKGMSDNPEEYNTLPNDAHMAGNERVGIQATGYLTKKGTPAGMGARFNYLPPGQDINNQECADIRELTFKEITTLGYPGDGWTGK